MASKPSFQGPIWSLKPWFVLIIMGLASKYDTTQSGK